jgi:hypothetical protein
MTYNELLQENARLREAIDVKATQVLQPVTQFHTPRHQPVAEYDDDDYYETMLLRATALQQPIGNLQERDVLVPIRQCSQRLIEHDKRWNSWIHYAVEYPQFESEHEAFMDRWETGAPLSDEDPSWLAIYFAIITVIICSHSDLLTSRLITYIGYYAYDG